MSHTPLNIVVAVNQVDEIGFRQTTALLMAALVRQGHQVRVASVSDFSLSNESGTLSLVANSTLLPNDPAMDSHQIESWARSQPRFSNQPIRPNDLLLIRTNPGRDLARQPVHDSFLQICRTAFSQGVFVLNEPLHLAHFANKASLADLDPKYCPKLLVSNRMELIAEFVKASNTDCVVKPLSGSRGQNVIRVSRATERLDELIQTTFRGAGVIVQEFVDSNRPGDQRVVTVGGKILEVDGQIAGIQRRPAAGDFRANLHAGGTAHPVQLDSMARESVEYVAEILQRHGIWIAGVDLVGSKIIELNVFSTGGIFDAEQFSGVRFSELIAEQITVGVANRTLGRFQQGQTGKNSSRANVSS